MTEHTSAKALLDLSMVLDFMELDFSEDGSHSAGSTTVYAYCGQKGVRTVAAVIAWLPVAPPRRLSNAALCKLFAEWRKRGQMTVPLSPDEARAICGAELLGTVLAP